MNTPSESNTEAYSTYLAEMGAVFASIKAMEKHSLTMTTYWHVSQIPNRWRLRQAMKEAQLCYLNEKYTRLTDAFCAKYELTEDERDYNFCN